MIHYQLRCEQAHEFDGWYKDSTSFDKLAAAGLVECPVCGSAKVSRALMAPAIAKTRAERQEVAPQQPQATPPSPPPAGPQQAAAGPIPAQMVALLQRMRAEVEKNCDYVGNDFADEARKMHRGESELRGIYGEASDSDAEELREEGIDIARLPWVPRADG
ncbi:ribosomal protein L32-like protein [Acetobacteraceae bacterium AT-5844]|nr:ribosomal protein L32-like protein [Acetobacteraceae bacterium AT-5844]